MKSEMKKCVNMKEYIHKLRNLRVGTLFYDNRFTIAFSVILSFVIWIIVAANDENSHPVTISGIPVSIQLSDSAVQDGLRIFSGQDVKVSVPIKGNRVIVGQVTNNDIQVVAQQAASTITAPGNYTLELTAKKASILNDYEFASAVQPAFITVVVDRYREAEFTIEPKISFTANPDYFVGSTVLSSQTVVLSGPESEISKIKKVVAQGEIQGELQESAMTRVPLSFYDAYDEPISNEAITASVSEVDVTVPVLERKEVPIEAEFSNVPNGIDKRDIISKITPSVLEIAGPKDVINDCEKLQLSPIDFKNINLSNDSFDVTINLPTGCKSLSNVYNATVKLNMNAFKEKSVWATQFKILNEPQGKKASIYSGGLNVICVGQANKINALKPADITIEVDFAGKEEVTGHMEGPAKIVIQGDGMWSCGDYVVNVGLT